MSRHIWSIEFSGNQSYTDDTLLKFLLTKDVHAGMAGSDVDCAGIAADIREAYHDIVWVSASVDGTRLKIRLKENDDRLLDDDKDKNDAPENTPAPTDLVADMDGTIRAITPREGVVLVQEGSEVKKEIFWFPARFRSEMISRRSPDINITRQTHRSWQRSQLPIRMKWISSI